MNKPFKVTLLCVGIFGAIYTAARVTGMISFYKVPTPSNEPTIPVNSWMVTSNLKKPSVGDFITFTHPFEDTIINTFGQKEMHGSHYIYRLCATEGDEIEMKNAVFFVNGKNADRDIQLYHYYKTDAMSIGFIREKYELPEGSELNYSDSLFLINLTPALLKNVIADKINISLYEQPLLPESKYDVFAWLDHNSKKWTVDNFGPLKVPAGHCFVLGDNRNNSLDSRYTGFVKLVNIKGVKL